MRPIGGLHRDSSVFNQPPDSYHYAANGIISERMGAMENTPDDIRIGELPVNFRFLGWTLADNVVYLFGYNTSVTPHRGQIYIADKTEVAITATNLIIDDPDNVLEFDQETRPLQFTWRKNAENQTLIAWVGDTQPKIINIDKESVDGTLTGQQTLEFLLMPEGNLGAPEAQEIEGGNVLSGAWMFLYRYVYDDGATTDWSGVSNAAYIFEASISLSGSTNIQGSEGNITTDKAVEISFNRDARQPSDAFVQFGYIAIRDQVTYGGILERVSIPSLQLTGNRYSWVFSGQQPLIDLGDNIAELITPRAHYQTAGTITSLTNRLYIGNLTANERQDFQSIANNITVQWRVNNPSPRTVGSVRKGFLATNPEFGAGEVYALYIQWVYKDGTQTEAFHIPGRVYDSTSRYDSTGRQGSGGAFTLNEQSDITVGSDTYKMYQVADTCLTDGTMGYWANQNERYPSGGSFPPADPGGGLYASNVRHHRTPSLRFLYENNIVDRQTPPLMYLEVSEPAPTGNSDIIGYHIMYARRSIGNQINLSYEWPTWCAVSGADPGVRVPAAGFWNITTEDPANTNVGEHEVADSVMRFHGLHLLTTFPAIQPLIVSLEMQYTIEPLFNWFVDSDDFTPLGSDPDDFSATVTQPYAYKYGGGEFYENPAFNSFDSYPSVRYHQVLDSAYIRTGVIFDLFGTTIDNVVGEDFFGAFVDTTNLPAVQQNNFRIQAEGTSFFVSLRQVPNNVFAPFASQQLVYAGFFGGAIGSGPVDVTFGDNFSGVMQFNVTGPVGKASYTGAGTNEYFNTTTDQAGQLFGEGTKLFFEGPNQSPINHNLQYSTTDPQSFVKPISGSIRRLGGLSTSATYKDEKGVLQSAYFYQQNIYQSFTYFYNRDYHELPRYSPWSVFDGFLLQSDNFPYQIAFSLQQAADSPIVDWRTWLINNRYVQPSDKGAIVNLQGAGNQRLYIHHRYSLFVTKDRTTLQGTANVTLGSSDVFEVTPYEMMTTNEGHTGLRVRDWAEMTIMGYVWCQSDHGKVFLHNGESMDEMSAKGLRTFFRDTIDDQTEEPFAFNFGYDEDRKQLLFSQQTGDAAKDFTISYSNMIQGWQSFHDVSFIQPLTVADKTVLFFDGNREAFSLFTGDYNSSTRPLIIEPIYAPQEGGKYSYMKSVNFRTFSEDTATDLEDYTSTFSKILIYNTTKISDEITLTPINGFNDGNNLRKLENIWRFNKYRNLANGNTIIQGLANRFAPDLSTVDNTLAWHERSRMRDSFLFVRLTFDQDDRRFRVSSIEFEFKPSIR